MQTGCPAAGLDPVGVCLQCCAMPCLGKCFFPFDTYYTILGVSRTSLVSHFIENMGTFVCLGVVHLTTAMVATSSSRRQARVENPDTEEGVRVVNEFGINGVCRRPYLKCMVACLWFMLRDIHVPCRSAALTWWSQASIEVRSWASALQLTMRAFKSLHLQHIHVCQHSSMHHEEDSFLPFEPRMLCD
jgi:hypothetical protein